jgi:hypothetical protein
MKKGLVLLLLNAALAFPLFSEQGLGIRLLPEAGIPLGNYRFDSAGFGMGAAVDWLPFSLPFASSSLGFSLSGDFLSLKVKTGDTLTLFEGGIGPLFQIRLGDRFSLQAEGSAGLYTYQWMDERESRMRYSFGVSGLFHLLPYVSLTAYGGYTYYASASSSLLQSIKIGAGVSFNLMEIFGGGNRFSHSIKDQRPVLPVSYAWYENNSFAGLTITNNEPNAITAVEVSLYLERYMNEPTLCTVIPRLGKGESTEVPVTALFNESMLDLTENINANARVLINYRSLGALKQADIPLPIPIHNRNAFVWDDDQRAASFVSARDPAAMRFARYVESAVASGLKPGIPRNVQYALGLFEALNVYGIKYLVDPASSYIQMSEDSSEFDTLYYPYQTLLYRGGDCDDLSILFCSMLEVLKIDTAFITIPGHIYMAFDSGLSEADARRFSPDGFIYHEGRAWFPLEITIPAEGFYRAWRVGAREWANAGNEARLYPMHESWASYQPVNVPGSVRRSITLPAEAAITAAFDREAGRFAGMAAQR